MARGFIGRLYDGIYQAGFGGISESPTTVGHQAMARAERSVPPLQQRGLKKYTILGEGERTARESAVGAKYEKQLAELGGDASAPLKYPDALPPSPEPTVPITGASPDSTTHLSDSLIERAEERAASVPQGQTVPKAASVPQEQAAGAAQDWRASDAWKQHVDAGYEAYRKRMGGGTGIFTGGEEDEYGMLIKEPDTEWKRPVMTREEYEQAAARREAKHRYSQEFNKMLADAGGVSGVAKSIRDSWNKTATQIKYERDIAGVQAQIDREMSKPVEQRNQARIDTLNDKMDMIEMQNAEQSLKQLFPEGSARKGSEYKSALDRITANIERKQSHRLQRYMIDQQVMLADERVKAAENVARIAGREEGIKLVEDAQKAQAEARKKRDGADVREMASRLNMPEADVQRGANSLDVLRSAAMLDSTSKHAQIYEWFHGLKQKDKDHVFRIVARHGGSEFDKWTEIFTMFGQQS